MAWWPRLSRDCEAWTRKYLTCRAIKGQPHGSASWRSERYTSPFRVLQVDLVGPLEPASDSNAYILTVIDCFSLWLWLVGLADKRPATVAQALYCQVYLDLAGFPVILRSDNGSEFVAELTMELNRLIGTTQVFGSAYHPRSQALIEGSHKPMEEVVQAYIDEYPTDWASKLPIARWAWNTSAKVSLAGMSPYQVVTELVPRNPLTNYLKLPNKERVTSQEYVAELMKATEHIYDMVRLAQDKRAENAQARATSGRIPRQLVVGQTVVLRRPPASIKHDGEVQTVSRKLVPKARPEIFKIIKQVGDSNYVLGDLAIGREVTGFKQPVHADRLVVLESGELSEPISEETHVQVEGEPAILSKQALDGRVLVEFASQEADDDFAHRYKHLGAMLAHGGPGVWIDLARFSYIFGHAVEHFGMMHEQLPDAGPESLFRIFAVAWLRRIGTILWAWVLIGASLIRMGGPLPQAGKAGGLCVECAAASPIHHIGETNAH